MKRCPECRRDYYDDTLLYCLEDGVALLQGSVPVPSGETLFFWHETWADKAALDEHFATPFFGESFKTVEEVAAEPPQINLTRTITDKGRE